MASKGKKSNSIRNDTSKGASKIAKGNSNKVSKKTNKVSKSQSKSTKVRIDRLNADVNELQEITQLLGNTSHSVKPKGALDVNSLKEGLKEDQHTKAQAKLVDQDLKAQLELLTGMGL